MVPAHTGAHADGYSRADFDRDSHAHAHADGHSNANGHSDADEYTFADTYTDGDRTAAHGDGYADGDRTATHGDEHADRTAAYSDEGAACDPRSRWGIRLMSPVYLSTRRPAWKSSPC